MSDLNKELEYVNMSLQLFLDNKFNEAENRHAHNYRQHFYSALSFSIIKFVKSMMTFEIEDIKDTSKIINESLEIINNYRKTTGKMSSIKSYLYNDYSNYTELNAHAELCFTELNLISGMMHFIENDGLLGFVQGALKIHKCLKLFKKCQEIGKQNTAVKDSLNYPHYESGVDFGLGSFNLIISLLPPTIIGLMKVVGISSDKEEGIKLLWRGFESNGLRTMVCGGLVCILDLISSQNLGFEIGCRQQTLQIINHFVDQHPEGFAGLFFMGRSCFIEGKFEEAEKVYEQLLNTKLDWVKMYNIVNWELYWVKACLCKWHECLMLSEKLCENSDWSKVAFIYMKSSANIAILDDQPSEDVDQTLKQRIMDDLKQLPNHKRKIAGKSIQFEKFCISRSMEFSSEECLMLPIIELVYVWNLFPTIMTKTNSAHSELFFKFIQRKYEQFKDKSDCSVALVYLFYGSLLRLRTDSIRHDCIEYLKKAIELAKSSRRTHCHIYAYAYYELSEYYYSIDDKDEAYNTYLLCKNCSNDAILKNRIHFLLHNIKTRY